MPYFCHHFRTAPKLAKKWDKWSNPYPRLVFAKGGPMAMDGPRFQKILAKRWSVCQWPKRPSCSP